MLEPDAGQLASPVLRGAQVRNGLRLLDRGGGRLGSSVAAPIVCGCHRISTMPRLLSPPRQT